MALRHRRCEYPLDIALQMQSDVASATHSAYEDLHPQLNSMSYCT